MVFESSHSLYEEEGDAVETHLFFDIVSPLDDVDGDGDLDFLAARPLNSQRSNFTLKGIVRAIRYRPEHPRFIRGDATLDGRVNLTDALAILQGLFARTPPPCAIANDLDGDGLVTIGDGLYLLDYVFRSHRYEPTAPYPECGRFDKLHPYRRLGCANEGSCGSR